MFDPLFFLGAGVHALVLIGVLLWACRQWRVPLGDRPVVIMLLFWATLALGAYLASLVKGLGTLAIYAPSTLAALGGLLAVGQGLARGRPAEPLVPHPPALPFASPAAPRLRRTLFILLGLALGIGALASLIVAVSIYPANADSMIYRLPRAFWYVSGGSFLHPFDSVDKRVTFYPLNGVSLYLPFVLYRLPGVAHNLPSLAAWLALVFMTWRFARELGADRLIALAATVLVALTPGIFAQATSTNDEILAAVSLLAGYYMGWRWLRTGRPLDFALAALAVGLSLGTKLHGVFLAPVFLGAALLFANAARRRPALLREAGAAIGGRAGLAALGLAASVATPFLFFNYASAGRFYFVGDFAHDVFNLGASLQSAFQNLLIYAAQMTVAPVADLNFWPVANDRQRFNLALNELVNPLILPFIKPDAAYYHMTYRFNGVILPIAVRFVEFSLWSGFVWMLWPWTTALALRAKAFVLRRLFALIALTPFLWLLLWSSATLYMEGTATYFTFYLIMAAPAAAFLFAPIRRPALHELRWIVAGFVLLTHVAIDVNMMRFNGFRAITDLLHARTWPFDWDLTEPGVIEAIRGADRLRVVQTHDKMPFFAYMRWNPGAIHYGPNPLAEVAPGTERILHLFPTPSDYVYGFMPLKIAEKKTPGLTYLGTIRAIGREVVFAAGAGIHKKKPELSDYIVLRTEVKPVAEDKFVLAMSQPVIGLAPEDLLEFRYELWLNDARLWTRDWSREPLFSVTVTGGNPMMKAYRLTLAARSALNHREAARATYQVHGRGAWIPEGPEY